jgi:hypothetical protein
MASIKKLTLILCFTALIANNVAANIFANKKIKRVPREFHKNSKNRIVINQYKKLRNKRIREELDENTQFVRVDSTLNTKADIEDYNDGLGLGLGLGYDFERRLSSNDDTVYMDNVITHFNNLIEESYDNLNNAYIDDNLGSDCTFYRACENAVGYGTYSELGYSMDAQFGNLSTNRDEIMFKKSISSELNETKNLKDICIINDQIDIWENHLEENQNGLIWQYIGTPDGTLGNFPAYNWTSNNQCPGTYKPELRPWYISGSSGQKNMIIFIDISSTAPSSELRIENEKEIAKLFLGTLSFRDFVTIIPYSDFPIPYDDNFLVRATMENINVLTDFVGNITINVGGSTNIGLAMQAAFTILENSVASGDSSGCTETMILLTNGENEIKEIDPIKLVEKMILNR